MVAYHAKEDGQWDNEAWVIPSSREEMRSKYDGWFEPVMQILDMVEKPVMWALFDHLPAKSYYRGGRICLLGDSAHATTPHHGAGAGMAVEDSLILSNLLAAVDGKADLERAFEAYDAVRRPRTQRLVASSRRVGGVYDFEDKETGDDVDAIGEFLMHAWDWIWKEDLQAEVDLALRMLGK